MKPTDTQSALHACDFSCIEQLDVTWRENPCEGCGNLRRRELGLDHKQSHEHNTTHPTTMAIIKVTSVSTGENFEVDASNVKEVKSQILTLKGIPTYHQAILSNGKALEDEVELKDGSKVQLSMGLHGGCGAGCNLCGAGAGCHCNIL
ncbi:hypothetical protein PROFUN_07509 [Planoprotostelium fungivorum]|uniref:Ubiquitin-like domain-containing protein n=1 Tax=Planoprotostelium fungivorum TaxID=1890364 RepID=A0A2P6NLK8_9EUKA|nr:hypothetical protein PROFUN_07509 [Planoprotostelium fungivorum]